jgi:peptidoglycan/xylan/chitin deacetylase (PgdA/CDA1 family)
VRFGKIVLSMPAVQVVHPPGYPAERAYAARVVLGEWLGLEYTLAEGAVAAWELHCNGATVSVPDAVFGAPEADWLTVDAGDDVFGTVFLLLTRYEETVLAERDEHDRFPVNATRQDLLRPEADDLALSLRRQLEQVAPRLEPRRHPFRVVPSHDVDYPFASPRLRLSALRRGQLRAALPHDPFDTFDLLMDESEQRGLRATFFFLADGSIYSLDDPRIRALLKRIHVRGHELGLHGGYETFREPARLKAELERLVGVCAEERVRQHAWGGRQHFLRWENPTTWQAYEEAGLAYDATLGYSARPGFRAGTCREYPVFDLSSRQELRLRERPLVLMDTPTLDRIDNPEATIRRLREECERVGGDFTVLWHNNWLVTDRQRRLLQAALGKTP